MNMDTNITTAVDSLVKLVNSKGRISVEIASKELGLPQNIINEWASFLDQEEIIHVEYKFTTPYLISKSEETKSKKADVDYELIMRKLEFAEATLMKEQPKDNKVVKQRGYLLEEVKRLIQLTRKEKITKDQLERFIKYYKIFKKE